MIRHQPNWNHQDVWMFFQFPMDPSWTVSRPDWILMPVVVPVWGQSD